MPDTLLTPEQFVQRFSGLAQPQAVTEATLPPATLAADVLKTRQQGLLTPEEFVEAFEGAVPGLGERTITAIGSFLRDTKENALDIARRGATVAGAGVEGLVAVADLTTGTLLDQVDPKKAQEFREHLTLLTPFDPIGPEVAQQAGIGLALDAATFGAGVGLGRLAKAPALAILPKTQSILTRIFRGAAQGSLTGAGVFVNPLFAPRGEAGEALPTGERAVAQAKAAAVGAVVGAALEGLVLPPIAVGARAVGRKLFSPEAITRRFRQAANVLTDAQLMRNTFPQAVRSLGQLQDVLGTVRDDLLANVAPRLVSKVGKPLAGAALAQARTKFARTGGLPVRLVGKGGQPLQGAPRQALLRKFYGEEAAKVAPDLIDGVVEQLAIVRGIVQALGAKAKSLGIPEVTINGILTNANRLIGAARRNQFKLTNINGMEALMRQLNEFAKQVAAMESKSAGRAPLETLKAIFRPGLAPQERFRNLVVSVRNNLFGYLSFVQDSLGNVTRLAGEGASRAVMDTVDVVLGNATEATRLRAFYQAGRETLGGATAAVLQKVGGQRMAAVVNRIRNRDLTRRFIREKVKPFFVAGEDVGAPQALTATERVLDNILFGGLKLKGTLADTPARRFAARVGLYDEAYALARKAGVVGAERDLMVTSTLRRWGSGFMPGNVQTRVLEFANSLAFIVPRGATFTRVADNPTVALFASPFLRFGASAAEWLAEFTPGLGFLPALKAAAKGRPLTLQSLKEPIAKQLIGAGALDFFDKAVYDGLEFTDNGVFYNDLDSGLRQRLPAPFTDLAMLNAAIRGDWERFLQAAKQSSLVMLGGGLLGDLPFTLINLTEAAAERVAFTLDRAIINFVSGKALLLMINGLFTEHQEEPFTEAGTFIPLTQLPLIQGRPRIRLGGGFEPSTARLLGTDLEVPRAFGSIVTQKELNDAEVVVKQVEQRQGRTRINLFSTPNELQFSDIGVPFGQLDARIQRRFMVLKQMYLGGALSDFRDNPAFTRLTPEQQREVVTYHNLAANDWARLMVEKQLRGQVSGLGELRPTGE